MLLLLPEFLSTWSKNTIYVEANINIMYRNYKLHPPIAIEEYMFEHYVNVSVLIRFSQKTCFFLP